MRPTGPRRRHVTPRRLARRLIGTFSLLGLALAPAGAVRAGLVPADGVFNGSITVEPRETTLGQFTQFTVSGGLLPVGPATIRLGGVVAGTVQVAPGGPGSTIGGFGPTDLAVPAGAAACDSTDSVTVDDNPAVEAHIFVLCPVLTVTPNPVYSGGGATDLHITGSGFSSGRAVALTVDGQSYPSLHSGDGGAVAGDLAGVPLGCGAHQLTATIQPETGPKLRVAAASYPLPAVSATITVLGCASSAPPPQIFAQPVETALSQFTQFSVTGYNLAAGPATIRLQGVAAGTVTVGTDGTFPTTDLAVPAGAAACGPDVVTIDDVTASIAQSTISVYCPAITVTPNPVFSGGAATDLSIAGTGFPADRDVDFSIDGSGYGTATSAADGSVAMAVPGVALPCGSHQVVATARPMPVIGFNAHATVVRATVPYDPPIPASADVVVLGCVSSPTPPQIHADPVETTLGQFTRFSVDGSLLPAGPATIRLRGAVAGTVTVGTDGTFRTTDFAVPAGAAACGSDAVTIDNGGAVLATAVIAVYCPSITVTPNPVDSGGRVTGLTVTGTGFPAERTVDLGFDGQARTTVSSDAAGTVRGSIRGVSPACGLHQATATARPPTSPTPAVQAAVLAYLPVSASATVTVVGCARITADPSVIQPGLLTHVTGTGFLPKTALTLTWQSPAGQVLGVCAPDTVSRPALTADAAGSVNVYCLAFRHTLFGALQLAAVQGVERETASVLIEDGPMQPGSGGQFVFRR